MHHRYNLTWSKHVEDQCAQSIKMLGYVRRSTLDIKTISVRRTLYLTLVRSKVCHASQVWAPQSVELIKRTERIQRRASKFILDLPFICDVSYSKRLELLDLIPLCYWHEFLDLVFYFKCKNGIININGNVLPLIQNRKRTTRSADPDWLKFTTPKCRIAIASVGLQYSKIRLYPSVCESRECSAKRVDNKEHKLGSFQKRFYTYYKSALYIYDAENPRPCMKSVCLSCNKSRNLSWSNSRCD